MYTTGDTPRLYDVFILYYDFPLESLVCCIRRVPCDKWVAKNDDDKCFLIVLNFLFNAETHHYLSFNPTRSFERFSFHSCIPSVSAPCWWLQLHECPKNVSTQIHNRNMTKSWPDKCFNIKNDATEPNRQWNNAEQEPLRDNRKYNYSKTHKDSLLRVCKT